MNNEVQPVGAIHESPDKPSPAGEGVIQVTASTSMTDEVLGIGCIKLLISRSN